MATEDHTIDHTSSQQAQAQAQQAATLKDDDLTYQYGQVPMMNVSQLGELDRQGRLLLDQLNEQEHIHGLAQLGYLGSQQLLLLLQQQQQQQHELAQHARANAQAQQRAQHAVANAQAQAQAQSHRSSQGQIQGLLLPQQVHLSPQQRQIKQQQQQHQAQAQAQAQAQQQHQAQAQALSQAQAHQAQQAHLAQARSHHSQPPLHYSPTQQYALTQQQLSLSQPLQHNPNLDALNQPAQAEDDFEAVNRKVAPRSSNLFRVGPSFSETRHHQDIYCKHNDMDVLPVLLARIDRGFEIGENGTWIGYKRNYFTLVAAFNFESFDFNKFSNNKFYTFEKSASNIEKKVEINYFAIRLIAKCSDDNVSINLIQHTAKRDKGPQFPPPIYPAVPGELPDHDTVKLSCNKRNGSKIENMNKIFYFDRRDYYHNLQLNNLKDMSILKNYPSDSIAKVARFERIQFTLSIRIKSSTINLRYFTLHVELLGIVEDEDMQIQPILLSSIETPPLIIRGRSPSNYHKERTSGYRTHIN